MKRYFKFRKSDYPRRKDRIHLCVGLAYFIIVAFLVFFYDRNPGGSGLRKVNFDIFSAMKHHLQIVREHTLSDIPRSELYFIFKEFFGNVLLFVPFPLMLHWVTQEKFNVIQLSILIFVGTICIEILQYIFSVGVSDIDDVVLNLLGGLLGIILYKVIINKRRAKS